MNRIPADAFEQYVALGDARSYRALASRLGVSKRAVTKRASAEGWSARLEKIEAGAREKSDEKIVDELGDMRFRHLRTLKAMNARALTALKEFPLSSGMEAMRAAEMVIKLERLVTGEATERTESVEDVTRHEIQTLLIVSETRESDG